MIALLEAHRAGLLGRKHWLPNIVSGIIVGIVALPLAMAFAIASGAKPEQGLYTAIVAGLAVSIFGGSRLQIAGPTGAFIVILAGITSQHGIAGLQLATLMAGCILVLLGVTRLGAVMRYIPAPVIAGFTAGIGMIIWVGQWQYFFGLPEAAGHFHQKLWQLLRALPDLHPATTLIGLLSLAIAIFGPRVRPLRRVPGPLLALVAATTLQAIFDFGGVATIGSAFGGIPQGLPRWQWPEITLERILELIAPAFAIAMLGAIESLLSAIVADRMAGTRHDSNQELIGQGLANILAPLFGGFAATGAIARTATNIRNGGTGPLAGIVHALTLVLMLLVAAPLAQGVPLATLAAILFVVAWNMSDVRHVLTMMRRAPKADVLILLATFLLTVFADLVVAVNIGVVLAMLHFLRRMAASVEVAPMGTDELRAVLAESSCPATPADVRVYTVEGPLFFGATGGLGRLLAMDEPLPSAVIIRLGWVPFADFTGLQALEDVIRQLQGRGVRVLLCGPVPRVRGKLDRAGLTALVGRDHIHASLAGALADAAGSLQPGASQPQPA